MSLEEIWVLYKDRSLRNLYSIFFVAPQKLTNGIHVHVMLHQPKTKIMWGYFSSSMDQSGGLYLFVDVVYIKILFWFITNCKKVTHVIEHVKFPENNLSFKTFTVKSQKIIIWIPLSAQIF